MDERYPDFPHHSEIHGFLREYAERFRLRDRIRFGTAVEHATRLVRNQDEPVGRYGDALGIGARLTGVAHDIASDPVGLDTRADRAHGSRDAAAGHVRRLDRKPVATLAAAQGGVEPEQRDRRHVNHDLAGAGNRIGPRVGGRCAANSRKPQWVESFRPRASSISRRCC